MTEIVWLLAMLAGDHLASKGVSGAPRPDGVGDRLPIRPPIKPGETPRCDAAPDRAEILRAMSRVQGFPYLYEEFRDDFEFTVEKLIDRVDPPRFFPMIGPAQLHHCHWKCTVYYTEVIEASYPFKITLKRRRTEIVYLNKDFLHICENFNTADASSLPLPNGGGWINARPVVKIDRRVVCIRASWNPKVQTADDAAHSGPKVFGLKGSVLLFTAGIQETMPAKGRIVVEAFDMRSRKLAAWKFDSATLARLQRTDMFGVGYTLFLPLDEQTLDAGEIKLTLTYHPEHGTSTTDVPTYLTLDGKAHSITQARHTEPRQLPTAVRLPRDKQMTLDQVVALSRRGIAEDIIIRQMDATGSVFDLSVDDILSLHDRGVSDNVIRAMQERRTLPLSRPTSGERLFLGEIRPIPGR